MFENCFSLTELNVSGFKTGNVKSMSSMFYYCKSLTSLDVSGFDTSNVTNMYMMFGNCSGLTTLDVSKFDTSKVTMLYGMFFGCSKLEALDVSGFNTGNAQLVVQVGNQTPMIATKTEKGDVVVGYDVAEDTYVYIYAIIGSSSAPATHRVTLFICSNNHNGIEKGQGFSSSLPCVVWC